MISAAAMAVDGGGGLVCDCVFMACAVKNKELVGIQGASARNFSTRLYQKLWEYVA